MPCTRCRTISGPFTTRLQVNTLCPSCEDLYKECGIPLYQAIRSNKTLSFAHFPSSTKHWIQGFRGAPRFANPILSPSIPISTSTPGPTAAAAGDNNNDEEKDPRPFLQETLGHNRADRRQLPEIPRLFSPRELPAAKVDMDSGKNSPTEIRFKQSVHNVFNERRLARDENSRLKRRLLEKEDTLKEGEALISNLRDELKTVTARLKRYKKDYPAIKERGPHDDFL